MADKIDDWIAIEYAREVLKDVRRRLKDGGAGPGAALTDDECTKVLACLKDPPFPNGRPPENGIQRNLLRIYCFKLGNGGMSRIRAVAATAKLFGCSKWTVNKALRA
jgi:hypothetical protein